LEGGRGPDPSKLVPGSRDGALEGRGRSEREKELALLHLEKEEQQRRAFEARGRWTGWSAIRDLTLFGVWASRGKVAWGGKAFTTGGTPGYRKGKEIRGGKVRQP